MRFFEHQENARTQTIRLLLLFALTVMALVLAVNLALAVTWRVLWPVGSGYPAYFFTVNTVMTLVFVLGGWWLETSALDGGGEKLARRVGAREAWPASRESEQKFCNIVSELAIAASMKPPTPMVLDRIDSINAFACGWDENDAVVAVTRGALDQLTRDELQGLVAHEFSHIREGDTRLNMRLAGMVFGLEMIFNLGKSMCEADDMRHRSLLALPGFAIKATGSLGWPGARLRRRCPVSASFWRMPEPCSSRAARTAWVACCARSPGSRLKGHRARFTRPCSTCCWWAAIQTNAGLIHTPHWPSEFVVFMAGPWRPWFSDRTTKW